ncbi:hypothetical protein tb265_30940 [Gemmatimonadetes bacterium T265]|nr:hypothetical protein tb265_30940 [Gemmatimonadetes bacterium T265]
MQKLNPDFRDALLAFNASGAEYLIVGAFAMAAHGLARNTGDIDFWVRPTPENARRVWNALADFGMPMDTCSVEELLDPDMVFQFGQPPGRVDVMTTVSGVTFDDAWAARVSLPLDGVPVWVMSRQHLVANKRASGRPKDAADVHTLESERRGRA